ncbi:protein containing GntR [Rhodopirellula maiorica SM1]|uniref:Protein containing GntR n=1 Tax=Rhodopirellula maiorica SM1 TaxID=1265738 RepID=M5RI83_9BACT|nr:GntR family transcriptional regulator [Rhodopirellula maiorica]EMI18891.1 protein containing GntR [Rhodopirellula maiorica SM1]
MQQSLAEKSYQYIRGRLQSGDFAPGKRLVNRTLASEIGVSVIPVREAINRLTSEGLVEHVPNAGAYVRQPNRDDLDNLYVLRDALESCAAAEAAKYITEDQLAEFDAILERVKQTSQEIAKQAKGYSSRRQLNRWLDDEEAFHELIIEASRNPLLAKVANDNRAVCAVFAAQRSEPQLLTAAIAKRTWKAKSDLVEALRVGDANHARQLMSDQIQQGRKTVTEFLMRKRRHS